MDDARTAYEELDLNSRLAKVVYKLRRLRPFYSAIYESLNRIETTEINTMAVGTNKLLYNPEFVMQLSFEEFLFVNLHEVGHVALMHVPRGIGKDKTLWNIACDLYINGLLAEEFGITAYCNESNGVKMPDGVLYSDKIDINTESVNDIYEELNRQADKNGYNSKKSLGTKYHFEYRGSKSRPCDSAYDIDVNVNRKCVLVNGSNFDLDIQEDCRDAAIIDSEAKQILNEAKIRHEMTSDGAGNARGLLEVLVGEILKSHLDWKKLLKKYCRKLSSKESSFNRPDKRMYYQRAIYPGQIESGDKSLSNVKVCIDVSGSISNEDIGYFYGQVRDILKSFKLDAELIFWDTCIQGKGDFSNFNEMLKVKTKGRGGTDPSCLFEYFDSKECKKKPSVILVFTDGYFFYKELEKHKWPTKYKDTIWVLTKDSNKTKYPFGKSALADFSDKGTSSN